jgi:Prokaryotic membrane lipoprotein lipid attachment site
MKKIVNIFLFAAIAVVSGCSRDNSNDISQSNVASTVSSGSWRVTYYWDTDHEETSNFNGYSFTFNGGSLLTAINGGTTVTGSWQTGNDNSTIKLIINFATPANFSELSEDWHVLERTNTKIRMQHISGGSGGTDLLTLERN